MRREEGRRGDEKREGNGSGRGENVGERRKVIKEKNIGRKREKKGEEVGNPGENLHV